MKSHLRELANAAIEPLELAGIVVEGRYAAGRIAAHGSTHIVIEHRVVRSSDPAVKVGTTTSYALCDGTREAKSLRDGLECANCDRCDEMARKLAARRRRDRRKGGTAA